MPRLELVDGRGRRVWLRSKAALPELVARHESLSLARYVHVDRAGADTIRGLSDFHGYLFIECVDARGPHLWWNVPELQVLRVGRMPLRTKYCKEVH